MNVLAFDRDPRYRQSLREAALPKCATCGTSRSVRIAQHGENERTVVCMMCGSFWTQRLVPADVEKR